MVLTTQLSEFRLKHFVVVRDFLEPDLTRFLTSYFRALRVNESASTDVDRTSLNTKSDACGDTVLYTVKNRVEQHTGLCLLPSFSIVRMYNKGDKLGRHKDGPANEVGVTICIDRDMDWPLLVDDYKTRHEIILNPGDALIFKGSKLEHWRDRYRGERQAQLLLGYVRADGQYTERAYFGYPEPTYQPGSYPKTTTRKLAVGYLARLRERLRDIRVRARGGLPPDA